MSSDMRTKAQNYWAYSKAAEDQAITTDDPQLKASFEGIARAYREMAMRARAFVDDDQTVQL